MDDITRKILNSLQKNGRLSVQELSQEVGLSPTPVGRRMKSLEEDGIISGYAARVDEEMVGFPFSVFVSVKLNRQIDDAITGFEDAIRSFPEVVDCWLMTGNRDYLLRIATSGPRDFEQFLTSRLTKVAGVETIESAIPLRRVKDGLARLP